MQENWWFVRFVVDSVQVPVPDSFFLWIVKENSLFRLLSNESENDTFYFNFNEISVFRKRRRYNSNSVNTCCISDFFIVVLLRKKRRSTLTCLPFVYRDVKRRNIRPSVPLVFVYLLCGKWWFIWELFHWERSGLKILKLFFFQFNLFTNFSFTIFFLSRFFFTNFIRGTNSYIRIQTSHWKTVLSLSRGQHRRTTVRHRRNLVGLTYAGTFESIVWMSSVVRSKNY